MNGYDDLDTYNGDAEHDMMVDYDYHINTRDLTETFDDEDPDEDADNLDDWD